MSFHVDTGRLKHIAASCEQQANHYEERRRTLAQRCSGLQNSWKGVSAKGFQEMSTEWIGSTQSTVNELRAIAHQLRELAEYYERLDREERRKKSHHH
jgi:WXG100 family type VII secretion target